MSDRESFLAAFPVSPATAAAFDDYARLVLDYNDQHNIMSASAAADVWRRHMHDSAQLYPLLPPAAQTLLDIGSGAGFPGIVLALLARDEGRVLDIYLAESVQKKAAFLHMTAEKLGLSVTVHAARAEKIGKKFDVVTARAVAPLDELLGIIVPCLKKGGVALLLKGARAPEELTKAQKNWHFQLESHQSHTGDGHILQLKEIARVAQKRSR
ncbi:MAG: 16S rRNA (guanine(527)-N(7))-methyltransferase RsmG [Alphaproteobacteria bacterium]|nr:16S rRNA (guanine(527)-N(7))-methyltransferase RsmG [Alphaproteobacteria bacterium]NDG04460.1 16S rRNA (guanine(527)-N(7))-methyltransferase RsmG [Alphaproteobacteria bacterium]